MVNSAKKVGNLEVFEDHVTISINPKIYPLDVVYSASYVFIDKAFVVIDGNPEEQIKVELRPNNGEDLEDFGKEFNNELINYAVYKSKSEENKVVRDTLIQRALLTNDSDCSTNSGDEFDFDEDAFESDLDDIPDDSSYLDDPLGIAKPWEENNK